MAQEQSANIFISWSGELSHEIATALHKWLPLVVAEARPWISSDNIRKGAAWLEELRLGLADCACSIPVLTQANQLAPWIIFEAAASYKAQSSGGVFTALCDLTPRQVVGPLSIFQATELTKPDCLKLCRSVAASLSAARTDLVEVHFETYWPQLEEKVKNALASHPSEEMPQTQVASEAGSLDELLNIVRSLERTQVDFTRAIANNSGGAARVIKGIEPVSSPGYEPWSRKWITLLPTERAMDAMTKGGTRTATEALSYIASLEDHLGSSPRGWSRYVSDGVCHFQCWKFVLSPFRVAGCEFATVEDATHLRDL